MTEINEWDKLLFLEEKFYELGLSEGKQEGSIYGFEKGRSWGFLKGLEISREIGFYEGCICVWSLFYHEEK
jgi:predicted transposase YdaD